MTIRLATPADLPKIPAIELSAAKAFRGMEVPEDIFEDASPIERWEPSRAAGTLWVATDADGEPVGFLAGTRHGERLHIDEFDVFLHAQGRGIGRRMLGHVIDWARGAGLESLSLTTFASVPWNGPFYRSCGFETWTQDLPPGVTEILADEAARGFTDRCAMRLVL